MECDILIAESTQTITINYSRQIHTRHRDDYYVSVRHFEAIKTPMITYNLITFWGIDYSHLHFIPHPPSQHSKHFIAFRFAIGQSGGVGVYWQIYNNVRISLSGDRTVLYAFNTQNTL